MPELDYQHINYQRIRQAILYVYENQQHHPSLRDIASHVGISEYHLQRIFTEWAGISPKQFLQFLSKENAKKLLQSHSVAETALICGYSGSSRLHDLMLKWEGITPGEYRQGGTGLKIHYGSHSCPFGYCFIALTPRGICKLAFFDEKKQEKALLEELKRDWHLAQIDENLPKTKAAMDHIFNPQADKAKSINVVLKGSPFQILVWEALIKIPEGALCSYQQVAESIDKPSSVRAAASAIAHNPVAYLIPCHRVIRSTGVLNNYRWGSERKAAMIGREIALNTCPILEHDDR